jgi:hypothetical protein
MLRKQRFLSGLSDLLEDIPELSRDTNETYRNCQSRRFPDIRPESFSHTNPLGIFSIRSSTPRSLNAVMTGEYGGL